MVDEFGEHDFRKVVLEALKELEESSHRTHRRLDEIFDKLGKLDLLAKILEKEGTIMGDLDALTAQVAANESLEQSAITLINGLAAQLAAIANDPAAVAALAASLKASADALSAAIVANTPAAPPATP